MDLSIPIFCDSGNVSAWEQGGMAALPIERPVTWRHYSSYMQVQQLNVFWIPIRNTILLSLQVLENQAESWQALHLRNQSLGLAESV